MDVRPLNVARGDNAGLKGWLQQHEANHKDRAWFAEVKQAIENGDWDRAWAYAGVVRYNGAYVDAKTADQMDAALGRHLSAPSADAPRSVQSAALAASARSSWTLTRMKHFVIVVTCVVLGTGFVLLVWPTAYRYDHVQLGSDSGAGPVFPVRINRWTGAPEILVPPAYAAERQLVALAWVRGAGQALPNSTVSQTGRSHGRRGEWRTLWGHLQRHGLDDNQD